jgi:hypothetical protein
MNRHIAEGVFDDTIVYILKEVSLKEYYTDDLGIPINNQMQLRNL